MFSFKELISLEHNSIYQLNVWKFMEFAMRLLALENQGYELLFMDEFSLSSRYNNYYGWTEKNKKGYLSLIYDSSSIFFVICFSSKQFYAIKRSSQLINSEFIKSFVKNIIIIKQKNQSRRRKFALICSNSSIHSGRLMSKFAEENKISIVMISPYWPCLNPCEHDINAIKSKVRMELINNK